MNERAGAWLEASLRHRLWFAETDEHDTASLPFALCRRGDVVVARNVSCGSIDGREIRAFDLEVAVLDRQGVGIGGGSHELILQLTADTLDVEPIDGSVVTERWECALVRAGAECWRLSISPEGVLSTLADLAIVPDQDLELEAFDRTFEVRADDRAFANAFLDPRMLAFLLDRARGCVVETLGNRLLVARPASELPDADAVLDLAIGVADRVPKAVRTLYPPLPAAALTPRCRMARDGMARTVEPEPGLREPFDPWPDVPGGWAPRRP